MRKIKAYYIDPMNNIAETREITPDLDTYYELIHTDVIDIVNRGLTNTARRFDIICDDNGLYADDVRISAIDDCGSPMLVGALLVVGEADEDGNETSLDDYDFCWLERYTNHVRTKLHPAGYKMLTHLTY